jgi:hypothetical protein
VISLCFITSPLFDQYFQRNEVLLFGDPERCDKRTVEELFLLLKTGQNEVKNGGDLWWPAHRVLSAGEAMPASGAKTFRGARGILRGEIIIGKAALDLIGAIQVFQQWPQPALVHFEDVKAMLLE